MNSKSYQRYFDDKDEEMTFPFIINADSEGNIKKSESAISSFEFKLKETVIQTNKPDGERNHNCKLLIKVNLTEFSYSFTVVDDIPFVLSTEIKVNRFNIVKLDFESNNFDNKEEVIGTIKLRYEKEKFQV